MGMAGGALPSLDAAGHDNICTSSGAAIVAAQTVHLLRGVAMFSGKMLKLEKILNANPQLLIFILKLLKFRNNLCVPVSNETLTKACKHPKCTLKQL